jgi:hypothetical protein
MTETMPMPGATPGEPAGEPHLARDETLSLISADKVEGTAVFGHGGHRLGSIDTLMIDKMRGTVEYAVLAYGGVLGFGARHYPLPWQQLRYDTDLGGYAVELTEEDLEKAPSYAPEEPVDLSDADWGERVHSYYGPSVSTPRIGF